MSDDVRLTDPIHLSEVINGRGEVRAGRLIKVTRRRDILVGELIDEDLLLCSADPDTDPDPHWMPHLAGMEVRDRDVAVKTATRHLISWGLLELGEKDGDYGLFPPHSVISDAFRSAVAAVTWRTQVRDEGDFSGAALLLPGALVLHDEIDIEMGQHVLVFRSAEREAAHLAAWMDPRAASRSTEPPIVAVTTEELRPSPDELAGRARTSTVVGRVARTAEGGTEQAVTAYGTDEGLWLLQGRKGAEPVATLQLVSDGDLLALTQRLTSLEG